MLSRSAGGVSPVRTKVRMSTSGRPCARSASRMPASGASQIALDVVRQRLERRDVDDLRLVRQAAFECLAAPANRSPRERPPASCPSRSARRSACAARPGSPARPAPAPGSAHRRRGRTRRRRPGERALMGSCGRYKGRKRRPSGQWVRMAEQFAKATQRAAGPQHSSALPQKQPDWEHADLTAAFCISAHGGGTRHCTRSGALQRYSAPRLGRRASFSARLAWREQANGMPTRRPWLRSKLPI